MAYGNFSSDSIVNELLEFISQASSSEADFNRLALKIFSHQFELNRPFQKYCLSRGKTPRLVKTWQEIPAVPINAFKDLTLSCIEPERCERTFMTSGTTRAEVKGKHFHPSLAVYDASMLKNFDHHFMNGAPHLKMGILFLLTFLHMKYYSEQVVHFSLKCYIDIYLTISLRYFL